MNIVDVVISKLKCKTEESLFNINSVLADPTKDGAVDLMVSHLSTYTYHADMLESAKRLKKQMETSVNENQDNANNS